MSVKSERKKIAVIGATGMLGTPVARELARAGYDVTAVVRNPGKAESVLPADMRRVQADLQYIEQLKAALEGHDAVYMSLSTTPDEQHRSFKTETDGVENVIKASKSAGIKRIAYLSSLVKDYEGIDWWVFDIKREAVERLLSSDIPSTIFYPSNFYENIPFIQMKANLIMLAGDQLTRSWWVGAGDFGEQVARSFQILDSSGEDREYPVQGPEPYSYEQAVDVFIENYSRKKLRKVKVPSGVLRFFGKFSREARFSYRIVYAINHYDEQFQSERTWDELGRPQTTLAEYASSL